MQSTAIFRVVKKVFTLFTHSRLGLSRMLCDNADALATCLIASRSKQPMRQNVLILLIRCLLQAQRTSGQVTRDPDVTGLLFSQADSRVCVLSRRGCSRLAPSLTHEPTAMQPRYTTRSQRGEPRAIPEQALRASSISARACLRALSSAPVAAPPPARPRPPLAAPHPQNDDLACAAWPPPSQTHSWACLSSHSPERSCALGRARWGASA